MKEKTKMSMNKECVNCGKDLKNPLQRFLGSLRPAKKSKAQTLSSNTNEHVNQRVNELCDRLQLLEQSTDLTKLTERVDRLEKTLLNSSPKRSGIITQMRVSPVRSRIIRPPPDSFDSTCPLAEFSLLTLDNVVEMRRAALNRIADDSNSIMTLPNEANSRSTATTKSTSPDIPNLTKSTF